ncbi:MAG: heme-copper oxidase subunit III, partial [Acidobacteriaceae bacterium]
MPATITPAPIDVERKDPGSGGRPPVHRRPTGGGGGDENWGRDQSRRGPRDLLTRCRMGLGAVLAGDLIFFFCLILAFYAKQHASHIQMESEYILDWSPLT